MRTTSCCGLCLGANDANIVAGIDLKIRQTLYARVQDSFQAEMQPFFDSCIFSGEERGVYNRRRFAVERAGGNDESPEAYWRLSGVICIAHAGEITISLSSCRMALTRLCQSKGLHGCMTVCWLVFPQNGFSYHLRLPLLGFSS